MILHDFECPKGHVFEKTVKSGQARVRCPKCKRFAEIAFLPKRTRQLAEPIVFYRCKDGKFSFPGQANACAPRDAVEKIECRTIQEYDRAMGRVNAASESDSRRRAEKMEQANAQFRERYRSALRDRLANEKDNFARDLYRRALAENSSDYERSKHQRVYSECMEFNASNREAEYRRGERGRK